MDCCPSSLNRGLFACKSRESTVQCTNCSHEHPPKWTWCPFGFLRGQPKGAVEPSRPQQDLGAVAPQLRGAISELHQDLLVALKAAPLLGCRVAFQGGKRVAFFGLVLLASFLGFCCVSCFLGRGSIWENCAFVGLLTPCVRSSFLVVDAPFTTKPACHLPSELGFVAPGGLPRAQARAAEGAASGGAAGREACGAVAADGVGAGPQGAGAGKQQGQEMEHFWKREGEVGLWEA